MPTGHYTRRPEHIAALLKGQAVRRAARTPSIRFWEKVDKNAPNGCWQWTGAKSNWGYGIFCVGGKTLRPAHRVSLDFAGVTIPEGMVADHICKNRLCVNPDHLRPATTFENYVLYSDSIWAKNRRKTHCKHGHDITQPDSYYPSTTVRGAPCRTCKECTRLTARADKMAKLLGMAPRPEWKPRTRPGSSHAVSTSKE
jgi:hypothetical protein